MKPCRGTVFNNLRRILEPIWLRKMILILMKMMIMMVIAKMSPNGFPGCSPSSSLLCVAMLCYDLLCFAVLRVAKLCYALLCYAMPCLAMLCVVMRCVAMLMMMMYAASAIRAAEGSRELPGRWPNLARMEDARLLRPRVRRPVCAGCSALLDFSVILRFTGGTLPHSLVSGRHAVCAAADSRSQLSMLLHVRKLPPPFWQGLRRVGSSFL